MSAATVRASTSGVSRSGTTGRTLAFPGTPQVGDPIGIWVTTDANTNSLSSTPTGWTLEYNTSVVNGSRQFLHKVYASGDGTSVTLNYNTAPNMAYVVAVLDGSVHSDFGTVGTITTRPASSTNATAVATGSSTVPNLVVFHEKAATHGSAATVSPTTTTIQYIADTTAAGASTYVGTYDDSAGTADRTGTWPTASTNAAGYQVPVALVSGTSATATAVAATATGSAPIPAVSATGAANVTAPAMTATGLARAPSVAGAIASGYPQSGAVTPSSVRVLYATTNVSSARIVYSTSSVLASPSYTTTLTPDSDGIVSATLTGLAADTVYYYGLEANGTLLTDTSTRGQIRTFPTAGSQANGSFLFGSCQYTDSNHAVFTTMLGHSTTYNRYGFLHLGDLHYRDWQVNSITSAATIKAQQKSSTQQPNFAALLAGTPWAYIWDNHDWGGAASDGTNAAASALEAMYRQMVPSYTTLSDADDASGAIDQTFDFGRVSFYVMDTRSQRSPGANTDNSSKTMLGAGQKARLKTWMSTNTKPVKILLEGIPFKNYGGPSGDRWGAYLTEFAELQTYFAASGKGALYGLSGDIHTNAADDGTNESYGHVPNAVASAFDQAGTSSATGWSQGVYPASGTNTTHNFGVLDIQDTGSTIVLTFTGYDSSDTSNITMTKTFTLSASGSVTAVVATGTGAALVPTVSGTRTATVAAVTATGTGSALAPSVSAVQSPTVLSVAATGTGQAVAPSVAAGGSVIVSVPAAFGTGLALSPVVTTVRNPTIAAVVATGFGTAIAPTVSAGGSAVVSAVAAAGTSQARTPVVTAGVTIAALSAQAAGQALAALVTATVTASVQAVRATGSGAARVPVVTAVSASDGVPVDSPRLTITVTQPTLTLTTSQPTLHLTGA